MILNREQILRRNLKEKVPQIVVNLMNLFILLFRKITNSYMYQQKQFIPVITSIFQNVDYKQHNSLLQQHMQSEGLINSLQEMLSQKQGVVYSKAKAIVTSIIQSADKSLISSQDQRPLSLFFIGHLYKLLQSPTLTAHTDSLLILLHFFLPKANLRLLATTPILPGLLTKVLALIPTNHANFLSEKYLFAVLTDLALGLEQPDTRVMKVVEFLVEVAMSGAVLLRREAGKALGRVLEKQEQVRGYAAEVANRVIDGFLEEQSAGLHLASLCPLLKYFPMGSCNDIAFKLKTKLRDQSLQPTQTYFLLQHLFQNSLTTSSISQQILKQLLSSPPLEHDQPRRLYGYAQALYQNLRHLQSSNPIAVKRYLSSVVSTFSELLLLGDKLCRQVETFMRESFKNCVRRALWATSALEDELLGFDRMQLEEVSPQGAGFPKLVCMLVDLLSQRYSGVLSTSLRILNEFFKLLDEQAFQPTLPLVKSLQSCRQSLPPHLFLDCFTTCCMHLGYHNILQLYPISIQGDPKSSTFQQANNLWLLTVLKRRPNDNEDFRGPVSVFAQYLLPIIRRAQQKVRDEQVLLTSNLYKNVLKRLWETLERFSRVDGRVRQDMIAEVLAEVEGCLDPTLEYFQAVAKGLEALAGNLPKATYSKKAQKLIPILVKLLDLESPLCQAILNSISSLSTCCSTEYLDRVFQKNLIKLLSSMTEPQSLKNLQILMAISRGVNFNDTRIISTGKSKEEAVLQLINSLVTSADGTLQKKGYKFLSQAVGFMPGDFLTEALGLLDLKTPVQVYSKGYRLQLLRTIWQRLGYDAESADVEDVLGFLKTYLPEVIMGLRSANSRLRRQTASFYEAILVKMEQLGVLENFVEMVCAGLAANSVQTKTDTVHALELALAKLPKNGLFLQQLTEVLLVLLQQNRKQLFKGVLLFLKTLFLKSEKDFLLQALPSALKAIFQSSEQCRDDSYHLLRHFLLKLAKRHGQNKISQMLPEDHRRLLKAVMKKENKEKRKRKERRRERREGKARMEEQESEDEGNMNLNTERMEQQVQGQEQKKTREKAEANNLLLKYDLNKEDFHFVHGRTQKPEKKENKEQNQQVAFVDGQIIFRQVAKRKRQGNMSDQQQEQATPAPRKKLKIKTDTIHQVKQSGSTFKAARAGGDMPVKNKPSPYAFIQLSSKALNKRYRHKAEQVFDSMFVRKEGGLKGLKSRMVSK